MRAVFAFSQSKADSGSQVEKVSRLKEQMANVRSKPGENFRFSAGSISAATALISSLRFMAAVFLLTLSLSRVTTQFNSIQVFPITTAINSKHGQGPMQKAFSGKFRLGEDRCQALFEILQQKNYSDFLPFLVSIACNPAGSPLLGFHPASIGKGFCLLNLTFSTRLRNNLSLWSFPT